MSKLKLLSVLLLALSCGLLYTETAQAAGESNNRLPSISASKGVVGAQTGNGVYSSPESNSYLYIRRTASSSSLTIRDISNQYLRARILSLAVGYLNTSGSCISLGSTITGSPVSAGFNNNRTYPIGGVNSYSGIRIVNDGNGNEYGVFCVTVATSSLLRDGNNNDRYQVYGDVTFILETNTNNLLGVFPGVGGDDQPDVAGMYSKGTGYYGAYNQPGSTAPNGEWSQTLAFAPDCTIPDGHMEPITLYDMDTYQASNRNATIRVTRKIGMSGTETNLVLTGDIINLGNGSYQLTNKPSGATHYATPQGGFSSDYKYTLYVTRIGRSNKIRIRLPYDQINASFTCTPPNTAPIGNYIATCNADGTGDITITANLSDADGDNVTVVTTVSGGITGMNSNPGNYTGAVGNGRTIGTVTRPPNGSTYTVSGTITDGVIASPAAMTSTTVTCPRPPTDWECTFATSGLTDGRTEVGSPFSIVVTISNTSAAYALGMNQSTHPVAIGASPEGLTGLGPTSGYTYSTGSGPAATPLRTATVTDSGLESAAPNTYTFTVTVGGKACTGATARVGNYSYLKEFGGDVWTGGSFASSCTPPINSPGRALGFARVTGAPGSNGGTPHSGMSTQLTLTALMNINGVYSASHRDVAAETVQSVGTTDTDVPVQTYPPKGLTFANIGTGQPDLPFGGGFGSGSGRCITDYFNDTRDITLGDESFTGENLSTSSGRTQFVMNGGAIGGGALTVPLGSQTAVFVDGNAYISGNIEFATGAASTDQLPNFALIVCGSIYIDRAVTRIDGLLVAQPGRVDSDGRCVYDPDDLSLANSGTIYTCATGPGQACTAANVYAESNTRQLSVNGSLVAHRIKFLRTYGSLRSATATEAPDFATGAGTGAAEVVNYTPQMYLARSALRTPGLPEGAESVGNGAGAYDSLQVLPPVF